MISSEASGIFQDSFESGKKRLKRRELVVC